MSKIAKFIITQCAVDHKSILSRLSQDKILLHYRVAEINNYRFSMVMQSSELMFVQV